MAALALAASVRAETTFRDHVRPILRAECMSCHNPDKTRGGLDLSTYEALRQGGSSGEIVAAGDPDSSRLYQVMAHLSEPFMPENASKRPDEELAVIHQWIAGGLLKQSGDTAKKPTANRVALKPEEATLERPAGPPSLPRNQRLEPYVRTPRPNAVIALAASPWAPLVAIGGHRQVVLVDDETRELVDVRAFDEGLPNVLRFSRNASVLLAGGGIGAQSGTVVLWDVKSGERVAEVGDEYDAVLAADLSPDQRWVVLGGSDRIVKVLSVETGEVVHKITKHTEWILAAAFSPDGVLLATGDRSGGLLVWETDTGQEFHHLRGHKGAITQIRWRRDSNVLASASEDGDIRLWDLHKGKPLRSWKAHQGGVLGLAYAKDGSLASVGRDGRARVWDANGKQQKELKGFADLPTRCAFSHDDARLVVGDWTGAVTVWNIEDGEQLGSIDANPPLLAERVEIAANRKADAQHALDPVEERERLAREARERLGNELAELETRHEAARNRQTELEQALEEAKKELQELDQLWTAARNQGEALDAKAAEQAEAVQATAHQLQALRAEWKARQTPVQAQTLSLADEQSPTPEDSVGTSPDNVERGASPDAEQVRRRLVELEAKHAQQSHDLAQTQSALRAVTDTEKDRSQAVKRSREAVADAERVLAEARREQEQAADVLPAKRKELAQAETQATEVGEALSMALATYEERKAEHAKWVEAARLHAVREAGISENGEFAAAVQPILETHCVGCHNVDKSKGGLRLDRPDLIVRGGKSGAPGLVFGAPDESEIFVRVSLPPEDFDVMPPEEKPPLSAAEIETIRRWIENQNSF